MVAGMPELIHALNHDNSGQKLMNPTERALAHPKSRAKAIAAKCYDCCGNQREEVRLCEMTDCPLYAFRPYKRKDEK